MSDCSAYKKVDPTVYKIMKAHTPSRYGDLATALKPPHTLPPITSVSRSVRESGGRASVCPRSGKRTTVKIASSIRTAETSSTLTAPMRLASDAVAAEPMIEPSVPPTPMKPNSRLPWSLLNESAIKHQKIEVLKSAKTDSQTKNTRPIQTSVVDPSPVETNRRMT